MRAGKSLREMTRLCEQIRKQYEGDSGLRVKSKSLRFRNYLPIEKHGESMKLHQCEFCFPCFHLQEHKSHQSEIKVHSCSFY